MLNSNIFIQTCIFPVRYEDFGKTGDGVVEKYILNYIKSFNPVNKDMIMTMSQGWPFRFDVDYMSCKHRGGESDNMFAGDNAKGYDNTSFAQLATGNIHYPTTLPQQEMLSSKFAVTKISDQIFILKMPSEANKYDCTLSE